MVDLEYVLPPIALVLMVAYVVFYLVSLFKKPFSTNLGINLLIYRQWSRQIIENPKDAIVAIQTLRNHITAASILASAAVVIAFFSFEKALSVDANQLEAVKFYVLGADLMACFLCMGLSVREASLAGFVAYSRPNPERLGKQDVKMHNFARESRLARLETPQLRRKVLTKTTRGMVMFWTMGIRLYYVAICLAGWLISPIVCIVIVCIVILIVAFLDRSHAFARNKD